MRPLAKVSPMEVQALYSDMLARGLAPRTVRHVHAVLRSALDAADGWRLLAVNPTDRMELPKLADQEIAKPLDARQVALLLRTARERMPEHYAMFVIATLSGLRPSEYLALRWSDVDGARVSIERSLARRGKEWSFGATKRKASRRTIVLEATAVEALAAHRKLQAAQRLAAGPKWQANDLVFPDELGAPARARTIVGRFKRLLRAAELPNVRLYDLRHTAATLAMMAAVAPKVAADQLGHADASMTLNVYSHVLPELQEKAAAAVERLVFGEQRTAG